MPLRASKNTYAYELVGSTRLRRKVMIDQWVPDSWSGDEAGTLPVDGAVFEEPAFGPIYRINARPAFHRYAMTADAPPPVLTGLAPPTGPESGGTSAAIYGENLVNPTSVMFGGAAAAVTRSSAIRIDCTTQPHAAGTVDVTVTTADGTDTLLSAFTYEAPSAPSA